jgi:hypothetical protein
VVAELTNRGCKQANLPSPRRLPALQDLIKQGIYFFITQGIYSETIGIGLEARRLLSVNLNGGSFFREKKVAGPTCFFMATFLNKIEDLEAFIKRWSYKYIVNFKGK